MKKTIVSLLVLAGCAIAADSITVSSKLSYTDANDSSKNFVLNAYDEFVYDTRTEIDDFTKNGINCIDADRLSVIPPADGTKVVTLNLGNMLVAGDISDLATKGAIIDSISFIGRNADDKNPADVTLSITLDGVVFTSQQAVYNRDGSTGDAANTKHGSITFNFTNAPIIYSLEDLAVTWSSTEEFGCGAFHGENGAVLEGTSYQTVNGVNWYSIAQVKMHVAPEPTTATLSLLALAGLAARRRRR
ncbi:MAG: PEP-CTERM sorting domain-containing protein [Akkermansia sp.]|nr:PEP-CTERM sorting domain-containing protein [Akkermansia sp.]